MGSKAAWLGMVALAVVPLAHAEIFKCVGKHRLDVYQNFPCAVDTMGSLPSAASIPQPEAPRLSAAAPPKPNAAATPATRRLTPTATSAGQPAGEPRAGMTADEVKALWGEPAEIIQDEPVTGRVDIWRYADGRSVQINNRQRVLAVQQR